ncbi:MAG: hypothetical protein COA54_11365 [Thiotrichaceae bacterium]|nr:MAG: hypothetical protein COA54_11365 [Thiotrichaceae bacterium]
MMNKKTLNALLFVVMLTGSHQVFAHASGGGGSSYDLDEQDHAAERAAEKQVAEKNSDEDDWADFMKAVDAPKQKQGEHASDDHGHHDDTK